MAIQSRMLSAASCLLLLIAVNNAIAQEAPVKPVQPTEQPPAKLDFEKTGPQVGEQVPDLSLHTMKGEVQRLSDAWRGGPALLVTSSLTCPKSRSRWPELKALVEKYDGKLNIVIVYVIEAHPVGSICPYKGIEDITPENERDGILRKQPRTLEDRLELAQEFKRLLRINAPIYVDNLKDEAWKGLGSAPNLALLVDADGIVIARTGWFEGKTSQTAIDKFLETDRLKREVEQRPVNESSINSTGVEMFLRRAGFELDQFKESISDNKSDEFIRMLKAAPKAANMIVPSEQGHPYEATMLMEAVQYRHVAAVKLLLEYGADVKAITKSYDSALQIAASNGDLEIAKLLLAKGADPAFPATGDSPLHEAAINGHTEIVKLLLATGLRHDIYSAIALGELELVRKGLKVDPSRVMRPDGEGRMPLDYAAANGQLEIAQLLLSSGAPIETELRCRVAPPLHRAIEQKQVAMVKLLLAAGSSPNTKVGYGGEYPNWTPALHKAIAQKNVEIVNLLITYKVDFEARDAYSQTALHDAAAASQVELVKTLLQAGADVNAKQGGYELPCGSGEEGRPTNTTPLHFAARSGNPATIKELLAGGAKLEAKTARGETPLMQAATDLRYRGREVPLAANVATLLAAGADPNTADKGTITVLEHVESELIENNPAAAKVQQEIIALLKKHGAKAIQRPLISDSLPAAPAPKTAEKDPFGCD
ncbi:ankyrin repeat domain-containing protein [Anatilimnocola sp. NA78]|uniref:ankyrin repeat domain-containing protein n=1 Tax=Anatilimnocola sp. NA78 TaxID=3415683 RepID=UPI003CE55EA4